MQSNTRGLAIIVFFLQLYKFLYLFFLLRLTIKLSRWEEKKYLLYSNLFVHFYPWFLFDFVVTLSLSLILNIVVNFRKEALRSNLYSIHTQKKKQLIFWYTKKQLLLLSNFFTSRWFFLKYIIFWNFTIVFFNISNHTFKYNFKIIKIRSYFIIFFFIFKSN